jgi:hypothetical protein
VIPLQISLRPQRVTSSADVVCNKSPRHPRINHLAPSAFPTSALADPPPPPSHRLPTTTPSPPRPLTFLPTSLSIVAPSPSHCHHLAHLHKAARVGAPPPPVPERRAPHALAGPAASTAAVVAAHLAEPAASRASRNRGLGHAPRDVARGPHRQSRPARADLLRQQRREPGRRVSLQCPSAPTTPRSSPRREEGATASHHAVSSRLRYGKIKG